MFTSQISSRLKTDEDGNSFWDEEATTITVKGGCITGATNSRISTSTTARTIAGVYNKGTFHMTAGTITGNSGDIGGGVYNNGTMTVSGKAVIEGNTVNGTSTAQNVYLTSGTKITVGNLTEGANIGVTTATKPTAGSPVEFTTNGTKNDEDYFFSDSLDYADKYYNEGTCLDLILGYRVTAQYCENGTISVGNQKSAYDGETVNVKVTPDEGYELDTLTYTPVDESAIDIKTAKSFRMPAKEVTVSASFKKAHIHSLTYSLSEDKKTVTATCTAEGCTATDTSLTIQAPANLIYDGNDKSATFGTATTFLGGTLPNITYEYKAKSDGTYATAANLTNTGYYKASFTVGTGEGAKTAYVEYEITKLEISTVTYTEPTAPVSVATPASAISGCGTGYTGSISWSPADTTYKYNTIYTATVTLTADDNYKFSDNVTVPNDWTKSENSTAASLILTKTYAATAKAKLLSVTAPDSSRTLTSLYNDAESVIATLPTTATVTADDGTTSLAVTWKLKDDTTYTNASSGTNTFTWSLTLGDLEANGKQITGDIVLTNPSHTHSWTYTLSEDKKTITASCGAAGCTATDTSLTIQAPANLTYDGNDKSAIFGTATTFLGGSLPKITYEYKATSDGNYVSTTNTIKAGYYKASFTVGTGEGAKTAYVEYEIEKATLTVKGTAADGKTYDGTTTANVTLGTVSGKIKDTDVTVSASGTFADKNAGKGKNVTITYSLSGDDKDNYKVSGDTTTIADIDKASLTISNAVIADKIYDGTADATVTSLTFDGLVGDETLAKVTDYTVSGAFDKTDATGTNAATKVTVTVTLNSTEAANNYKISGTKDVDKKISKATQTVSAPTASEVGETSVTLNTQSSMVATKYGINTKNEAPEDWQDSAEFTGLTRGGTYYFFVKFEGNDNYEESVSEGTKITVDFCQYYTTLNDSDEAQTLVLGENVAGDYIITKVNCGYTIQTTEGKYIALSSDGKSVVEQSASYTWSYDGGLYNTVKTTTTTRVVFWKWFAVKTTNSYLTVNENKELAVSSSSVTAQILVTGTHEWAYPDNGDGNTHSVYCKNCYTVKGDENHKYGDDDCCEKCGAYNPAKAGVTGIAVKESKSVAARGFWFWTRSNAYIYTISPTLNHVTAKQVQYSLNQSTWTTGCSILSDTKLSTFYIRVTDSNGKTTTWKYVNGNVTKEN